MNTPTDQPKRKGHISTERTVWCGLCHRWQHVAGAGDARIAGWRYTKASGWICPPDAGNADAIKWDIGQGVRRD